MYIRTGRAHVESTSQKRRADLRKYNFIPTKTAALRTFIHVLDMPTPSI